MSKDTLNTWLIPTDKDAVYIRGRAVKSLDKSHHVMCIIHLIVDLLIIFILLRSLNPPGEEDDNMEVR